MATLIILLNSQSQQNPADTASAVSNSQDPMFTSKRFENTALFNP